jgi:hypothetical protein
MCDPVGDLQHGGFDGIEAFSRFEPERIHINERTLSLFELQLSASRLRDPPPGAGFDFGRLQGIGSHRLFPARDPTPGPGEIRRHSGRHVPEDRPLGELQGARQPINS